MMVAALGALIWSERAAQARVAQDGAD
jgi:hypothetical protein